MIMCKNRTKLIVFMAISSSLRSSSSRKVIIRGRSKNFYWIPKSVHFETVHFAFLYFLGWFFTKCFQSSCSSTRWIPSFFYVLWCSDAKRRKPYQSRKRNDCSCNKFSKQLYVLYCGSWCPVENLLKKSSARRSGKIALYLKGFLKNSIAYLIANYLVHVHMYLTIIPRVGNGYEMVNS